MQYPLPYVGAKEHAEFLDVLSLLEAGDLTPEQAQSRVMAIYQIGIGAWIRALGETRPNLVSGVVGRLMKDLDGITTHYDPAATGTAAPRGKASAFRLTAKTNETLLRERIILGAVIGANQTLASARLHDLCGLPAGTNARQRTWCCCGSSIPTG